MKARITLKIHAGAKRTRIAGRLGNTWKVDVASPPVDGKANQALMKFIAAIAGVPVSAVRIASGHTSGMKTIDVDGVDTESLNRAILESHGPETNTGSD